ncbi:MAG: N-acetyltransferase [Burkholderiaceae bacterium]|nr:N-acetyltransferase [Burkholderiaceae bacterium]
MAGKLTVDFERVARFALPRTGAALCMGMRAIGYERDGKVVAGFLFDLYDGQNIWAHVALESPHDLPRALLGAMLRYIFVVCGCQRAWARVCEDNVRSARFVERLGAHCVALLPGADGDSNVLIYRLLKSGLRAPYRGFLRSTAHG